MSCMTLTLSVLQKYDKRTFNYDSEVLKSKGLKKESHFTVIIESILKIHEKLKHFTNLQIYYT